VASGRAGRGESGNGIDFVEAIVVGSIHNLSCTMAHFPSFLVGSAFAGVTFLALHQQLSHRERLSYRWKLQG
jgi:hypothetical protein